MIKITKSTRYRGWFRRGDEANWYDLSSCSPERGKICQQIYSALLAQTKNFGGAKFVKQVPRPWCRPDLLPLDHDKLSGSNLSRDIIQLLFLRNNNRSRWWEIIKGERGRESEGAAGIFWLDYMRKRTEITPCPFRGKHKISTIDSIYQQIVVVGCWFDISRQRNRWEITPSTQLEPYMA